MKTDTTIKQEGFDILKEKLGVVNAERFIVLMNRDKFDYTKWREKLFEDMTIDELAEQADNYSKNYK